MAGAGFIISDPSARVGVTILVPLFMEIPASSLIWTQVQIYFLDPSGLPQQNPPRKAHADE